MVNKIYALILALASLINFTLIQGAAAGQGSTKPAPSRAAPKPPQPQAPLKGRMLDVVIFLDTSEVDNQGPMLAGFALALCQKSVLIIVTNSLLNLFLKSRHDAGNNPELQFPLNEKDWNIYSNKSSYFIFIPTSYQDKLKVYGTPQFQSVVAAAHMQYTVEDILIGLRISSLQKVLWSALLAPNAADIISSRREQNDVAQLKNLFTFGTSDLFGLWNIVLGGHGEYPKNIDFSSATAAQIDISGAQIADLKITEFRDLMQFLTTNLKTNFLYYMTCYGGDYNLILPYMTTLINEKGNIIGIKKPNFTIAVSSLTSQEVSLRGGLYLLWCSWPAQGKVEIKLEPKDGKMDYAGFFAMLRKGVENATRPVIYKDIELKDILNQIVPRDPYPFAEDPYGISALPQVMFPGTDTFRALALDEKISVISDVLVRKHEFEKKPIELIGKDAILLYPRSIDVELIISERSDKKAPAIVSMQPGIGLHKINRVVTKIPFAEFIKGGFGSVKPVFAKFYYIAQLQVKNDQFGISTMPEGPTTLYDLFIMQKINDLGAMPILNVIFTGPDKKTVYINELTYADSMYGRTWHIRPSIKRDILTRNQAIADPFLNTVYDYFYAAPIKNIFGSGFNKNDLERVLTKEEKAILNDPKLAHEQEAKRLALEQKEDAERKASVKPSSGPSRPAPVATKVMPGTAIKQGKIPEAPSL